MTAPARAVMARRIMGLPALDRDRAIALLKLVQDARAKRGALAHAKRDPLERRKFAGDPWAYASDVYGLTFVPQQSDVVQLLLTSDRLLIPAGNNVGKTLLLGFWALYRFDVLAALEGGNEREQGCRILLPGPDHPTVFATIYSRMLVLARRAELRGHLMPGERSELSVSWRVRAEWTMEAFSPPTRIGQNVAHTVSGRHHRNQAALIEEGQGVPEAVWRGVEGMCSSDGNQIVSSFNPTEPIGPAHQREKSGSYRVIHLSALDHPNILQRRGVVPDAVAFKVIDARVRADARDRGPYPGTPLETENNDFVYALPTLDQAERGPREDGFLGHPDAPLHVYRPESAFTSQVMGEWATDADGGLFRPGDWDAGVARWKHSIDPSTPPDRVGGDMAREGRDNTTLAPAWGKTGPALLRLYADAQLAGAGAITDLVEHHRIRIGTIRVLPKGDGPDTAAAMVRAFPRSPFVMDASSVGASPFDHITRVMHRDAIGVSFSAVPFPPLPGEPHSENLRTQLYVRAAMLTHRGLIDSPDDPLLREEIMAHRLEYSRKTIERKNNDGRIEKIRVDVVALVSKDEIKSLIGRSPDRAEAYVLSLFDSPPKRERRQWVPASESTVTI